MAARSPAHALTQQQVAAETGDDVLTGLSRGEAQRRLGGSEYGRNELDDAEGVQPLKIVVAQIANAMTLVLILAMAVSFGIGPWIEGGVVAAVVLLNVVVGFFQEYSAEKTMDSLRSLSSPTATVVRAGEAIVVPLGELVPGDLVEVKTDDTVPADLSLIEVKNFETDEALTGESLPVRKSETSVFADATGQGDRLNIAYSSSNVTNGRAKGIVLATGAHTELGAIAAALQNEGGGGVRVRPVKRRADRRRAGAHRYLGAYTLTLGDAVGRFLGVRVGTPLQRKLRKLAMALFGAAVVCAIVVLAANRFHASQEVVIYAVAAGLSMIPASLVIVLTITMAAGTKRMVQRNVIVRNLCNLEALGAVMDICTDKTGTPTQGKMVACVAWVPALGTYTVEPTSEPFNPMAGAVRFEAGMPSNRRKSAATTPAELLLAASKKSAPSSSSSSSPLDDFLAAAALANLATVFANEQPSGGGSEWVARGDPTEIALQVFTGRFGWNQLALVADGGSDSSGIDTSSSSSSISSSESSVQPQPQNWTEVAEFPFDSDVKRMSVVMRQRSSGASFVFTKGAVERVIGVCTRYHVTTSSPGQKSVDAVAAIEEGRRIFDNIHKFVLHVLAENVAQACTLLIGLAFKDGDSLSVFPLAPVDIAWIIMITSGLPDMGLGFERAAPDIMRRPPPPPASSGNAGGNVLFTGEFIADTHVYGLGYRAVPGQLRELVDTRRSFFYMRDPAPLSEADEAGQKKKGLGRVLALLQWVRDVWQNQFLFWAVLGGFVTLFPTLYNPVINHAVFRHTGISWEWGIVFVAAALFFAGIEAWKWAKRIYFRRAARKSTGRVWCDLDVEERVFGGYFLCGAVSDEESDFVHGKGEAEGEGRD
ncbi:hypothetical protein B0T24DRAFT_699154 [Lasiosphaeria ovina]|uniref:Cation-transporting P-type ATPase N-terminal domain-containing protein n=1 Tax=Lasiosphaeria ovina TaxID=92902 RepID=A0AAE0KFW9_9PEZI|nr:hypothetical protein B0T24DRAFT_699154 [Lasiosphaeria ovina]